MFEEHSNFYSEHGYCIGELVSKSSIEKLRQLCESYIKENVSPKATLYSYHNFVDEIKHRDIQYGLTQKVRELQFHTKIATDNVNLFKAIIGLDIDIQAKPYIRISRPGVKEDNIGFHRDTAYGNSAYEMSCVLPIEDFLSGSEVYVLPDSHRLRDIEYELNHDTGITKGSKQNEIGFLYLQKRIKNLENDKLLGPSLKKGQFLMFSLGLIHGQEVNDSNTTRWSIDFRLRNPFHPQNKFLKSGYYSSLLTSPSALVGRDYYENNKIDLNELSTERKL